MNSRLALAAHVLTFLHMRDGQPANSPTIGESLGSNPSHVRRLLVDLTKAGLTMSTMGTKGGTHLARPASEISLLDVYLAVNTDGQPILANMPQAKNGPFESALHTVLDDYFNTATEALKQELKLISIEDVSMGVMKVHAAAYFKPRANSSKRP